jgi:hypothetical protein
VVSYQLIDQDSNKVLKQATGVPLADKRDFANFVVANRLEGMVSASMGGKR